MKAVIFDLDGTLIDSMWLWNNLAENYLLSIGIDPPEKFSKTYLRKLTLEEGCLFVKEKFRLKETVDEIQEAMEDLLVDYYKNRLKLKAYVLDVLNKFKKEGTKMAIATATDKHLVEMVLDRYYIRDYFEFIQTVGNTGIKKSQPKFFQKAADRLNVDSKNIWVFEDALHCIVSAKECGLKVVAVKDKSALPDLDEIKRIADIYVEDFSQLEVDKLWKNC